MYRAEEEQSTNQLFMESACALLKGTSFVAYRKHQSQLGMCMIHQTFINKLTEKSPGSRESFQ